MMIKPNPNSLRQRAFQNGLSEGTVYWRRKSGVSGDDLLKPAARRGKSRTWGGFTLDEWQAKAKAAGVHLSRKGVSSFFYRYLRAGLSERQVVARFRLKHQIYEVR